MSRVRKLVLIGGGGHARDLLSSIRAGSLASDSSDEFGIEILGYVADEPDPRGRLEAADLCWLGPFEDLNLQGATDYLLAIGYPEGRRAAYARLPLEGMNACAWVDSRAIVDPSALVASGATVLWGACCSPNVELLEHSSVSYGALIGHGTQIGAHSVVMPGAIISGDVHIGPGVLIGSSAIVLEKLRIGEGARIGAGAVVTRDVAPGTTVVGAPARVAW